MSMMSSGNSSTKQVTQASHSIVNMLADASLQTYFPHPWAVIL